MSVRGWVAAGCAALVVCAAIAVTLWMTHDEPAPGTPQPRAQAPSQAPTEGELAALGTDLGSGDLAAVREVLAIPDGVELTPDFVRAVRGWDSVTVTPGSYEPTGPTSGEVEAVVESGTGSQRWILSLDLVGDDWLVGGTRQP